MVKPEVDSPSVSKPPRFDQGPVMLLALHDR
jgi:hypothetical protein